MLHIASWHAIPAAMRRQCRAHRVASAALATLVPCRRERSRPARPRVTRPVAAATVSPELALTKQLAASASVAATVLVISSLCTSSGRQRWADLLSNWQNALPANPAFRRALAWLPVIVAAKWLESVAGLPLLNWVYVAIGAQTFAAYAGTLSQQQAGTPVAEAAAAPREVVGTEQSGTAAGGGLNGLARNLFATRFPELASEEVMALAPAMLADASGSQAQGQLYVTASSVAFHGAFGRSRRIISLGTVTEAQLAMPDAQTQRSLSVLRLTTGDGQLVVLSAVNLLGGTDALQRIAQLCNTRTETGA